MAQATVLLTLLLVLVCFYHAEGKVVVVGGWKKASPWQYNVINWKQKIVRAGDVLVFRWRFLPHDVWIMNTKDAYTNCDFSAATKKTGITVVGTYRYKVPTSAAGTTMYFGCSVPGHCTTGKMKVAIKISA
ncbi:hypothetical protein CLOM_g9368 [Closterium sp. NIES-68]|nr:hypothetical protein CLOM_g4917 [Closterium sp. NIES-68]GJP50226.1 hypothetical protein CLOM_g9368 [Closterium sp. NIES-68]GJP73972.1 hypothetical protein CLOP_g4633 [Closterium sp. NIES-67]